MPPATGPTHLYSDGRPGYSVARVRWSSYASGASVPAGGLGRPFPELRQLQLARRPSRLIAVDGKEGERSGSDAGR